MTPKSILPLLFSLFLPCMVQAQSPTNFVFVKINESITPIEREGKYETPLDEALKKANLGEVTGGGSSLSADRKIEWVGIDVDLIDLDKGLAFLRQKLIELGAPEGSTLEYKLNGKRIEVPVRN